MRRCAAGGELVAPYSGWPLERAGDRGEAPGWLAGLLADPRARVRPLWRDQCLAAGEPLVPVLLPVHALDTTDREQLVLLGLDDGAPELALDLSELDLTEALERVGADNAVDVRELFAGLSASEAAALAHARGLLYWHRHRRYCGSCGSVAQSLSRMLCGVSYSRRPG